MCLESFSQEAPCGSILVNDHFPYATTKSLHFSWVVVYVSLDCNKILSLSIGLFTICWKNCLWRALISVSDTEFVLDFASKSVNNYIQPSTVMPSLKHLTVSFWMKTKLLADAAIVHYATSEEINSLYVGFGPNGPLNLYVMSSRWALWFWFDGRYNMQVSRHRSQLSAG